MQLLIERGPDFDVGDGAKWLVVLEDEDSGLVLGGYVNFYGRVW